MKELKGKLIQRIKRTPTIESFRFSFPEKAIFLPGQYLQVIFDPQNRKNKELNKYLSFSSSPTQEYVEITKRLSASVFSQKLSALNTGAEAFFKLPMGECVFREEYEKIGFLIGGIGITPAISILQYIIDRKLDTDACLFYSNRTEEEIAFKAELDRWQEINKRIKVYYTVTDCRPKQKRCLFGFIDRAMLEEKACDLAERVLFIFGPPKMVDSMCSLSLNLECKRENIKSERFIGY